MSQYQITSGSPARHEVVTGKAPETVARAKFGRSATVQPSGLSGEYVVQKGGKPVGYIVPAR